MTVEICSVLCVYISTSPLAVSKNGCLSGALLVNSVSAQGPVRTHRDL